MVSRPSLHREETFLLIPGNNHTELGLYYLNLEPNHKQAKKIEEIKQKNHKRDYGAFLNYIFALFVGQNIFMTINNTKGVNLFYFDSQGFEFVKFYNFESQVKGQLQDVTSYYRIRAKNDTLKNTLNKNLVAFAEHITNPESDSCKTVIKTLALEGVSDKKRLDKARSSNRKVQKKKKGYGNGISLNNFKLNIQIKWESTFLLETYSQNKGFNSHPNPNLEAIIIQKLQFGPTGKTLIGTEILSGYGFVLNRSSQKGELNFSKWVSLSSQIKNFINFSVIYQLESASLVREHLEKDDSKLEKDAWDFQIISSDEIENSSRKSGDGQKNNVGKVQVVSIYLNDRNGNIGKIPLHEA